MFSTILPDSVVGLVLLLLFMYSVTFGMMYAKLFADKRAWLASKSPFFLEMISCPYCTGFHAGWLSYLMLHTGTASFHLMILFGFVNAIVSYLIEVLLPTSQE